MRWRVMHLKHLFGGRTDGLIVRFLGLYVAFQREINLYGLPGTTSYSIRVWWG